MRHPRLFRDRADIFMRNPLENTEKAEAMKVLFNLEVLWLPTYTERPTLQCCSVAILAVASAVLLKHLLADQRPLGALGIGLRLVSLGVFALEGALVSLLVATLRSAKGNAAVSSPEARRQRESLRCGEERFRLLVERVEDHAIFMLDPDGCVVSCNAGAERATGYRAKEIIGKSFFIRHRAREGGADTSRQLGNLARSLRCRTDPGLRPGAGEYRLAAAGDNAALLRPYHNGNRPAGRARQGVLVAHRRPGGRVGPVRDEPECEAARRAVLENS